MIQPTPKTSILANDNFYVWGASMAQTKDGVCHLLYCRWPKPFRLWITDAEIAYAKADKPSGPYIFQRIVLGKRGAEFWDGVSVYNPQVLHANGKYYLYYTGNNGDNRLRKDAKGNLITQRIGVAVADHPAGPWKRMDTPLIDLSEEGVDSNFSCNPAVTQTPDGTFLMVYKCGYGTGRMGPVVHTTAVAKTPLGPFVKTNRKVFAKEGSRFPAEDPFIWHQEGKYYAVLKDMRGDFSGAGKSLVQFESPNGHSWKPSDPVLVSKLHIQWKGGHKEKVDHLERPQIWMKDGQPAILFLAAKKGDHSYNVHMPLAPSAKEKETEQENPHGKK
ncbi:MAG: glycoside hydrolase family protein, partial [Planctomycetota bacterium]|nr:glycoside hydrolase family protein [Planctomycetota bacterium]